MSPAEVRAAVHAVVAEIFELEPAEVDDEASLEELGVDSVSWVEIVVGIERRLDVALSGLGDIVRVGELVDLALRHAARRHARG